MKKKIYVFLITILLCFTHNVYAESYNRYGDIVEFYPKSVTSQINVSLGYQYDNNYKPLAEYFENEIIKYLDNVGTVKWSDEYIDLVFSDVNLNFSTYKEEYAKDNLGTTEKDVRSRLSDLWKKSKSLGKYAYVPAELSARGVTLNGGSTGQSRYGGDVTKEEREFTFPLLWYPVLLDDVISIYKDDANGQKISFNYQGSTKKRFRFDTITDSGNVLDDGTYVGLEKLKITKSEYEKIMSGEETLKLYIYNSHSPFAMDYLELLENDTYHPYYITKHAFDNNGNEIELKSPSTLYYKSYETFELNKDYIKNNAIYGLYLMQTGGTRMLNGKEYTGVLNDVLDPYLASRNLNGLLYYYRFKIELEIVDDGSNVYETSKSKDAKDIRDNGANIFINEEKVDIENKKSWTEGRIYVKLKDACEYFNCESMYKKDSNQYKVNYFPIEGNKNIVYSLVLNENNNKLESILKVYDEVYTFRNKILDASPYVDNDEIYVPIRFLLEGLGAIVDYYPTDGRQPEEVHITTDTNEFISTQIDGSEYSDDILYLNQGTQYNIEQFFKNDDKNSLKMSSMKLATDIDELKICDEENDECDLYVSGNKIKVISNKKISSGNLFIISKYNDYPFLKKYRLYMNN